MDIDLSGLRPYPKPPPEVAVLYEGVWPGSRTQKFGQIIAAVDCAAIEAQVEGDQGMSATATRSSSRSSKRSRRGQRKKRDFCPCCGGESLFSLVCSRRRVGRGTLCGCPGPLFSQRWGIGLLGSWRRAWVGGIMLTTERGGPPRVL